MGAAYFYHLTRRSLDATLQALLERSLQQGWRVAVRGTDAERLAWLDAKLWDGPQESFLPHGLAGGPHDADQPILLTLTARAANEPACVMAVDGAAVDPDEVKRLDRVCILFEDDEAEKQAARAQWKALTGAGCAAQYWSEESGRWEKMAEA
ncbi:DNA polymerase III subunit chi [Citreimonas salinaria]|uniref:DNA polymerase III, chi subunit n=1 Tax=Citreimonas salinaria TaxID=321339 RepID=A0A1H3GZM0_9RHOB|nr:DNA polymerase III subunit chi [Citreimonas salinaria]SDY08773.1 DNA polymerase III, chi subunit [Citreimonas salinaria]